MLACRHLCAVALLAVAASQTYAQSGHYPGPRTRYEWNPSPYTGSFNSGYRGSGGWSSGYSPGYGYGYPGYGYGFGYGYPLINPPIFVPFGATYYGTYGDGWYGPQWPPSYANWGYSPVSPFVAPGGAMNGRWPAGNDPLREPAQARRRERLKPEDRLPVAKPSTPEEQQRSLQHMATGDQQFKGGRFLPAAQSYRKAIAAAEDLPDNYFRLALALAELRRYDDAVAQLKYGLLLDPTWPTRGDTLASYYGDEVNFGKASMMHRVGDWVRGDARNPDRIFLLAVLLYFDGDRENARTLFESAIRVAGEEPHLTAFLDAENKAQQEEQGVQPANNTVPAPPPAGIQQRPASPPTPPASTGPDELREQPVPQRLVPPAEDPVSEPEKFPSLKTPDLPRSSEPPASEVSTLPPLQLSGPKLSAP